VRIDQVLSEPIDSLGLNYIIKVFLLFVYVSCEGKYCDAKSELANLHLRNVVIIAIIAKLVFDLELDRKKMEVPLVR